MSDSAFDKFKQKYFPPEPEAYGDGEDTEVLVGLSAWESPAEYGAKIGRRAAQTWNEWTQAAPERQKA